MSRITVKKLICDPTPYGLGYCCIYAFFRVHKRTGLIAERLGICDRAVRYHKADFKAGEFQCESVTGKCLKGRLF